MIRTCFRTRFAHVSRDSRRALRTFRACFAMFRDVSRDSRMIRGLGGSRARALSTSDRIVHFHTSAYSVSRHTAPKRSPLPPRVVPVQGYTGLCAACLRAAVISHGSRRRAASGSSSRHRRTSDESFMRTLARHASPRPCTRAALLLPLGGRGEHGPALLSLAGQVQKTRVSDERGSRARASQLTAACREGRERARGWSRS